MTSPRAGNHGSGELETHTVPRKGRWVESTMRSKSPIFVALFLLASCLAPHSAVAQSQTCVKCHVKEPERAADQRVFDVGEWERSVHAALDCTTCHEGADPRAFDQLPHRFDGSPPGCLECHDEDFPGITEDFRGSVHARQLEAFTCMECHSPHFMRPETDALPREERVLEANGSCIICHSEDGIRAAGREGAMGVGEAHAWDPAREAHTRIRCVVCHTAIDASDNHEILPSDQSIRSCDACHDVNSPMIAEYVGPGDPSSWVTNPLLFQEAYLPGATRNRVVDSLLVGLFLLTVCGVLGHALLRVLTRRNRPRMSEVAEKVSMYPAWLRAWHWLNALLIVVLGYTGVRMHFGAQSGPLMSFETAFNLHNLAGSLLLIVGVLYFIGNYIGRNQQQYLSKPQDGFRGIMSQARWYLLGIFKGEPHPYHASPEHKFNPMQHLAYSGVMYVMYPLVLLSGVALLFPDVLPGTILGRPGVWWVAAAHWILSAGAILFLVGHLYLGSTGDKVRDLYAAMLDGQHRHRTPES